MMLTRFRAFRRQAWVEPPGPARRGGPGWGALSPDRSRFPSPWPQSRAEGAGSWETLSPRLGSISYLWGAEAEFCNKFAPFIGNQNVEFILNEIELAMRQVSQNGNAKIIFTHFALAVSKTINRLK